MSLFRNPNESNYQGGKKHILESLKNTGPAGVLVWKQPEEDFNTQSVLTVNPGEEAVFVKNGEIVHVFGSGRHVLTTENYAFLSRLRNMLSGGISTFNCFVYFVRKADTQEILWGTASPIQLRDPVQGIATSIKAHGSYKIMVEDSVKFITKLIGSNLSQLKPGDLDRYFSNQFQQSIKATIAKGLKDSKEELLGICAELDTFANKITPLVSNMLAKYGLKLQNFSISAMDIPEDDPNRQLLEGAFARKREFDVMGEGYQQIKGMEIMREMAGNTTSGDGAVGSMASVGMGVGMGMAAGGAFGQMAGNMFNGMNNNPNAQQAGAAAGATGAAMGAATSEDPFVKLTKLKQMLDAGLISQQEYDAVKQQVLSNF